ncbi:MAG: hypothetical protein WDN48_05520 [Pseudolabrys sp.]
MLAAVTSAMVLNFAAADPALAKKAKGAKQVRSACVDRPVQFNYTFRDLISAARRRSRTAVRRLSINTANMSGRIRIRTSARS